MKSLKNTKTAENLLKAFAGEAQARNRYTYYAKKAKKEGYEQIAAIFLETAENELAHAKRFFEFLTVDFHGEEIEIQAGYPVGLDGTLANLAYAAAGEYDEWSNLYPAFANVAEAEGFPEVALCFREIIKVEKRHETRYNALHKNIMDNNVFKKDVEVIWKCRNCGYVYIGNEAPLVCPACLHKQKYFELFVENY